ncbi:MAG TPA: PAS domain S-box protein [Thermoanaerobaculia bacterium]|nr:PAS domain S-box protein [Thermoanaerobaculia bacterium]
MQKTRVALFFCSTEEVAAVRRQLGAAGMDVVCVVFDGDADLADVDVVIIGSFAATRHAVLRALTPRLEVPAIMLVPSIEHESDFEDDFTALSLLELRRLPKVIRRELRVHASETALRESERRYRELIDQAQEGIWVVDTSAHTIFINPKMAELLGTTPDAMVGAPIFDSIDAEMRGMAMRELHRFPAGVASAQDFRFQRADGGSFWAMLSASPLFDENGRYHGAMVLVTDITPRKLIENELRRRREALQKSEARYRALFEQAKDVIVTLDASGRITSLNPAFETITGWNGAQWIGREFGDLIDLEKGAVNATGEILFQTSRGETITVDTSAQELTIDGVKTGTLVIARDVTQRRMAEADLEREKRLASLGQLATSVAHEFNNVLMSILPFAELLQRRATNDERTQMATKHIIQAVRRGRQVSQEILRFGRPATPALGPIGVTEWLADFSREARAMLGTKYRFESSVASEDEIFIEADRALLEQVATNLVFNARDAMPAGGRLEITARCVNDTIEIAVRDSGPGIPMHLVDRIFDPLFSTKPAGNGLGLTIASQAMSLQRGALRVESEQGAGSTFTMVFVRTAPPAHDSGDIVLPLHRRRVLIVEDDESVGEGIRALLLDEGCDVQLVGRALEAPPVIERSMPDVVLLDVNLPDISGVELYEQLHERWPALPVIFSTGHADAAALDEVRKRHVPSIMKPYDISELLSLMATVCRVAESQPSQSKAERPQLRIVRSA